MDSRYQYALNLTGELSPKYGISSLDLLLQTCLEAAGEATLELAVLGRFKAGKSSFLNSLLGQDVLPVGVLPLTSVITEIAPGPTETATVHFADGRIEVVDLPDVRQFVAESENRENVKGVSRVVVETPAMARFGAVRLIDTPGLESAFTHNAETALHWLPKAGLALVAISVDPPLSQQDLQLLKSVYRYTPSVFILLTKADLLSRAELKEVIGFVREQVKRNLGLTPAVLPYSVRDGHDDLREQFEDALFKNVLSHPAQQKDAILRRKLDTLLGEMDEFLNLALKSAEALDRERGTLRATVIETKEALSELKSEIQLITKQAAAGTRNTFSKTIERHREDIETSLLRRFEDEFASWSKNLSLALVGFQEWLQLGLTSELGEVSRSERQSFLAPLEKTARHLHRSLQNFRDRLSERTMKAFGVALRTTEAEINVAEPAAPDIRIGRVFDRNWELLSPILPMWAIGGLVRKHFRRKISYLVYINCSRLTSQWEESVNRALFEAEKEAKRRLDDLVTTMERMTSNTLEQAPGIRNDLARLADVRRSIT